MTQPSSPPKAVTVNLDDPEQPPTPYEWSEDLDANTAAAIDQKVAGVVAGFGVPPAPSRPQGFDPSGRGSSFDPRENRSFTPRTYEALVAVAEDKVASSGAQWRIDVVRDRPTDSRYKGFLSSEGKLSNAEFARRFGGGDYSCTLAIERELPNGRIVFAPVVTAKLSMPGEPVSLAAHPHQDTRGGPNDGHPMAPPPWATHESEKVAAIKARADADQTKFLLERALSGSTGNTDGRALVSLSETSLRSQAEQAARAIEMMQRQLEQKDAEISRRDADLRQFRLDADAREADYRKRVIEEQASAAQRIKEAREEAERAAEVRYESRIRQKEAELTLERQEKDRIVSQERDFANRRVDMFQLRMEQEVQAVRAEADRNLEREKGDRAREVASVRATYETQLNAAQRENTRDRESTSKISEMMMGSKESQLLRLEAEVARLREENERYRAQIFKPFPAQVKEFQAIAPVLGYQHTSEQEPPEPPEARPEPPKSIVEQIVASAPTLLRFAGPAMAQFMGQSGQAVQGQAAPPPPPLPRAPLPQAPVVVTPVAQPVQTLPTVAGGPVPVNVPSVAPPRRRPAPPPPPPPPVPGEEVFEEIVAPAAFRKRHPEARQPASPSDIQALLSMLTEQAKNAIAVGSPPSESVALVRGAAADQIGRYTAWADADNVLVLLGREDGVFWGREDAREWFTLFWNELEAA